MAGPESPAGGGPLMVNAVFEGGGVRGIAHVGAMLAAQEHNLHFGAVAGTSAGAIVAALYAAGYTAAEIETILFDVAFDELLDPRWSGPLNLLINLGFYKGARFHDWIHGLLRAKNAATFAEVAARCDLTVIASDVTKRERLSFSAASHPAMEVAEAVRMSIGLPFIFEPYRHGHSLVVDGGILSNYPVWVFRHSQRPTLGFKLVSVPVPSIAGLPGVAAAPPAAAGPHRAKGIAWYVDALINTVLESHEKEDLRQASWATTIHIPTDTIKTTQFKLSRSESLSLRLFGHSAASSFFASQHGKVFLAAAAVAAGQTASGGEGPAAPTVGSGGDPATGGAGASAESAAVLAPMNTALLYLQNAFDNLPRYFVIRAHQPPLSDVQEAAFRKADAQLLLADQLGILDRERKARLFRSAAIIYSGLREFHSALERLHHAEECGDSPAVQHQIGRALAYLGADTDEPHARADLLTKAEARLKEAISRGGRTGERLADLAFVADERGELREAIELLKEARSLDPKEEWIAYNFACVLSKVGRYAEAFRELVPIIDRNDNWRSVGSDPDLEPLLSSVEFGPALEKLCAEAGAKARGAAD